MTNCSTCKNLSFDPSRKQDECKFLMRVLSNSERNVILDCNGYDQCENVFSPTLPTPTCHGDNIRSQHVTDSAVKGIYRQTKDYTGEESDPTGRTPKDAGAKLDAGKNRCGLVLLGFARALQAVSEVGTYGAAKYSDNGWKSVPDAEKRYTDAMMQHLLKESQEHRDSDSGLLHAAHAAWNALARLEFILSEGRKDGKE